jgi:hypothetical protein
VYIVPLVTIVVIALAIFLSPIFAVVILVLFLLGLGAFKYLGPGTEPEHGPPLAEPTPPANAPASRAAGHSAEDEKTGLWGETWPEERKGEEPS